MAKRSTQPPAPSAGLPPNLRARIKALHEHLAETDADALLVTNPRDIRYLTGFVGDDSWALVRRRSTRVHVLSDFRFGEQIAREAPHVSAIMRKRPLAEELKHLADRLHVAKLGVQPAHVSLAERKVLARQLGSRRLAELDDRLLEQRSVKSDAELAAIRRAIRIQESAFQVTLMHIEPGMREREIAAHLEYQMRLAGAEGRSFPTIVAADANASLPHAVPGEKRVRRGGIVLIDWGARYGGYCSDLTRVVAIGRMKPKLREIYSIVRDAQWAGIEAVGPGKPMKEVDAAARQVIERAGYGRQFGHSLGHGIGMDIHELPTLSPRSEGELEPGQVVTIEPGIYLPGVGGVRIEDDVLVTDRGRRVMSRLPKDLESAII
ncbi:MAG: aminopeptidase P family protein [Phycisphaeraceae bacterium]